MISLLELFTAARSTFLIFEAFDGGLTSLPFPVATTADLALDHLHSHDFSSIVFLLLVLMLD